MEQESKDNAWNKCHHYWIKYINKNDNKEYCACIKCGLDYGIIKNSSKTTEEIQMIDFLQNHPAEIHKGFHLNCVCNLDEAKNIYNEIINEYPNLYDTEFSDFFNYKISKKKVLTK